MSLNILFVLGLVVGSTFAVDYCDPASLHCQKDTQHVACNNNNDWVSSCREPISIEMTDEIKQALLDVHNELRNDVALGKVDNYPQAANMATMGWDDTLAKFAEMNVHKCEMEHDGCMNTEDLYPVGQNLAMSATSPDQPVMKDPKAIANMAKSQWFDGERNNGQYYGWAKMINNFDLGDTSAHEVGHFTQFIRAEADKIGCAASSSLTTMQGKEWRATWLACNYSFGNLITTAVYKAGEPASACKTGKNPKYEGLCSTAEEYASRG